MTYWKQGRIYREIDSFLCQCWIIRVDDALAGYITLLADKLQVEDPLPPVNPYRTMYLDLKQLMEALVTEEITEDN